MAQNLQYFIRKHLGSEESVELCAAILTVKETGLPIILIDQDVAFLEQIIDTLYLFDHGRISGRMSREEMPDHDGLMAILFGDQH